MLSVFIQLAILEQSNSKRIGNASYSPNLAQLEQMLIVAFSEAIVDRLQDRVRLHILGKLLELLRVAADLIGLSDRLSSLVAKDIPSVELQNLVFSEI